jgi:hypothetical protein
MKKYLVFVIAIILLLTSCQKSPDKPVVIDKEFTKEIENDNTTQYESYIYYTKYNAPEKWQENITPNSGKVNVLIDSKVVVPDVDKFPLIEIQNYVPTQKEIDEMVLALTNGADLYVTKERSRKDIKLENNTIKEWIEKINDKENKTELDEYRLKSYLKQIEVNKDDMKDAPKYGERVPSNTKLIQSTEEERHMYLRIEADLNKNRYADLAINIDKKYNSFNLDFFNLDLYECINLKNFDNNLMYCDNSKIDDLRELNISSNKASQIAVKTVNNMGFTNYNINKIGNTIKDSFTKYPYYYECAQCYVFYFTPTYSDVPVTYESTQFAKNENNKYWAYENLIVCVDDTGVIYVKAVVPSEVVHTKHNNLKLKDFETIQDIFRKQIMIKGMWDNDKNIVHRTLYVDEVTLGFMKTSKPDDPDHYLLIPVWDFFGYVEKEYDNNEEIQLILDENNKYKTRNLRHSYLTINAIDGSIIDRTVGH